MPDGDDGTVDLYNVQVLTGFTNNVQDVAWFPDSKFLAVGTLKINDYTYDTDILIWGLE